MTTNESAKQAARRLAEKPLSQGFKPDGLYAWPDLESPLFYRIRLKNPDSGDKWIRPMYRNGVGFVLGEPKFTGKKPLYKVADLAKRPDETVWIVEGEPKVEALNRRGLLATTSGSADSANAHDWTPLEGRNVIVWRDNDEAGLRYANDLSESIKELGCTIAWIDIEKLSLPEKGDCIDWFERHPTATKAELENLPLVFVTDHSNDQWDPPTLFNDIQTPDIPATILPEPLSAFAAELALATETPEALATVTILAVVSVAAAKRFVVSPKEGWHEPVNIYTLVALPPANNKSLVLKRCTQPLVDWEKRERERLLPDKTRQESERKTQEKRIEALRNKAAKEDDLFKRNELEAQIVDLESRLIVPTPLPQLFINNVTPETLCSQVHEQGGRLGVLSDEGGVLETLAGLYTNGRANIDIILKGIDGGDVRVRRKDNSGSFNLNPFLTMALTVQPAVVENMARTSAFQGNGMLERWLYLIPRSNLGYRTHDKPPVSAVSKMAYECRINELLDVPEQEEPRVLSLTPEAYHEWRIFQLKVEPELLPNGRLEVCKGWGGKISGFALRLAGLLHVAECPTGTTISDVTMRRALTLADALIEHALAAFDLMEVDEITATAQNVYKWILNKKKHSFTKSEFTHALRNKKKITGDKRERVLRELIDRHILSGPLTKSTRKPTTIFEVNPLIIEQSERATEWRK